MSSTTNDDLGDGYAAARAAWPDLDVPRETFAARATAAAPAHHADLYLACACSDGDPAALAELDRRFAPVARDAAATIDRSPDFVAEVQQILRERMLVGPHAKIRDYRGNGPLAGWIRTAAVRTALNLRRSTKHAASHHAEAAGEAAIEHAFDPLLDDPALALMRQRYKPEIDAALRTAIAALPAADRLLLQFYYVDGLTLAKIATLERVGTSTIFRRLAAATQRVLGAVKATLVDKLGVSRDSLDSLIRCVQDDIDLSLSQLLR